MDNKLALIHAATKKVADSSHPISTVINSDIDNKLTAFQTGIKSKDPHDFTRAYVTLGSRVFGSKINLGTKKAKPIAVMKGLYGLPLVSNVSRLTRSVETGWTPGKELHYESFQEGPLAAFAILMREMTFLKKEFIKKKLLTLTPEEDKVYNSIFNEKYLQTLSELIKKSKATTEEGLIKDFTTKGFDSRTDFICEMIFRKFRNNATGYQKLIEAIRVINAASKPIFKTTSAIAKATDIG